MPNFVSVVTSAAELAHGEKSRTHSLNHSPSFFDAAGTEAFASEKETDSRNPGGTARHQATALAAISKSLLLKIIITINDMELDGLPSTVTKILYCIKVPLPSARQHSSYGDCLEVKREYYQNSSVLDCVTQCSQSAAHLYEQFLQVKQVLVCHIGTLTLCVEAVA